MQFLHFHFKKFVVLLTATASGCSAEASRYIRFPDFAHPGPAAAQQAQAIQHDPYPLNDVGPEIVGGRPLAYQQPLTEEERALLRPPMAGRLVPVPAPGAAVVAPPVLSSPVAVAPPQPGVTLPAAAPAIVTSPVPMTAPSYSIPPVPPGVNTYPSVAQPAGFPTQPRAPY
ncbi:MAG TPA: hypothetical protein VH107_09820 [Lacipirellulaceae bacterium]|nr:hypothetical protein [Lacipirellulaceae bacterium]